MKSQTLQRQFRIWTVLLIVVPSLLIMAVYTLGQIKAAKMQSLDSINQRVSSQQYLIEYWVAERLNDVRSLSRSDAFQSLDERRIKRALDLFQQGDKNFDSLSFINKDGYFRVTTLSGGIQFPSADGRPYFTAAMAGKEFISDVVIGRNSGLPIINFSCPVYDDAGNVQGLILGSVKLTMLETLLHDNQIGATGEVFIVNQEGTMLTEPRYTSVLIAQGLVTDTARMKFKITTDAFRNISLSESGTATWVDYLGDKVLGAYRSMPERGWTVIGKIKEEEVLAPIYHQLAIMAGGTILLLLLFLPLATLIINRIKGPIDWLIGQSNLVAMEEYEKVGHEKCGEKMPREVERLCETFVAMSRKIEKTVSLLKDNEGKLESNVVEIQDINTTLEEEIMERQAAQEALRQLNLELESRVRERTTELQDLNTTLEEEVMERQDAQEALRQLNTELEDKVQERTSELQEINATLEEEIMERQSAQEGQRRYAEEVAATNRELQSFTNIVAHDFRSPMVNLKGFSKELGSYLSELKHIIYNEIIESPQQAPHKLNEILEKDVPEALNFIYSSVDRLDRMINTLLKLAREGRREMVYKDVDCTELVNVVIRSFEHQITQNGSAVVASTLPTIKSDRLALEQIISNLLDNAIKYLEPGRPGIITISCTNSGTDHLFNIQDNGRGIASGDYEKIFELFRRVGREDVPGEGMGLAYVRTLVRHLGGKIWCESELGVGTSMYFTLPHVPGATDPDC